MKPKYKVGDKIVVKDKLHSYSSYNSWAKENNLTEFVMGELVSNGYSGKIVVVGKHPSLSIKTPIYGILCSNQHYVVSEDGIALVHTKDTGEDLIGKKFTRGGSCVYTFEMYSNHSEEIVFSWANGSNTNSMTVEYCRKKFKIGNWELKPEEEKLVSYDDIANTMYSHLLLSWDAQDISELHDKTVRTYLDGLNLTSIKESRIRKLVQNISSKAQTIVSNLDEEKIVVIEHTTDTFNNSGYVQKNNKWQSYDLQTETYLTKQEEKPMENEVTNTKSPKTHQTIAVQVPMSAYAETTVITMYGHEVDKNNESNLFSLLSRIESEQAKLKDINKTAKSTRVTAKIAALGSARNKVVIMIDALPEE
jgi:hypothetical protein